MTRFQLESLQLCGAKTRSGSSCKRYGNKTNGRCKLHGGRSTGARSKEGKMALKTNPIKNSFTWYCAQEIDERELQKGVDAFELLVALLENYQYEDYRQAVEIVGKHRIELEYAKYYIAHQQGYETFAIIQSALDCFYTETDAAHLHFHIYAKMYPMPCFNSVASGAQTRAHIRWGARKIAKGKFW